MADITRQKVSHVTVISVTTAVGSPMYWRSNTVVSLWGPIAPDLMLVLALNQARPVYCRFGGLEIRG